MRLSEIKKIPSPRKKKRESPKRVKSHSPKKNNKLSEIKKLSSPGKNKSKSPRRVKLPSPGKNKSKSPKRLMKTPTNTNMGTNVYLNRKLRIPVGDGKTIELKIGEKVKIIQTLNPKDDQFKSWVNSPDGWAVLVYNDSIAMGENEINASKRANKVSEAIVRYLNGHPDDSEEDNAAKLGFTHLKSNGADSNAGAANISSTLASLSGNPSAAAAAVAVGGGGFFYRYKGNNISATAASNFLTTNSQQRQNIEENIENLTGIIERHIPENTPNAVPPGAPTGAAAAKVTAVTAVHTGLNNIPGLITSLAGNTNDLLEFVNYIRQFNPGNNQLNDISNLVPNDQIANDISNVIAIAAASDPASLKDIILEGLKLNRDGELVNDIGGKIDTFISHLRLTTGIDSTGNDAGGGDPVGDAAAGANNVAANDAAGNPVAVAVGTVAPGADLIVDAGVTAAAADVAAAVAAAILTIATPPVALADVNAAKTEATNYSNFIFDPQAAGLFQTFANAADAAGGGAVSAADVIRNVQDIINIIKQIISRDKTNIATTTGGAGGAGAVNAQVRANLLSNYIITTLENIPRDFAGIFKQPDGYDTIPYFPPEGGKGDEANPGNTTDAYTAASKGAGDNKIEGPGNLLLVETEKLHKFAGTNEKKKKIYLVGF